MFLQCRCVVFISFCPHSTIVQDELSLNFHPLTLIHSRSNFKPSFNFLQTRTSVKTYFEIHLIAYGSPHCEKMVRNHSSSKLSFSTSWGQNNAKLRNISLIINKNPVRKHTHKTCFLNFNLFPYQNYNRFYKLCRRNIDSRSVLATIWRLNYNLVEPNTHLLTYFAKFENFRSSLLK